MKNEKFLLDIQTKSGDIVNEILNAAIDAEQTFRCKWLYGKLAKVREEPDFWGLHKNKNCKFHKICQFQLS